MTFRVELHCDQRRAKDNFDRSICRTDRDGRFGVTASNSNKAVTGAAAALRALASKRGWEFRHGRWWCDNCLAFEPRRQLPKTSLRKDR